MVRSIQVAVCDDEEKSITNIELFLKRYEKETGECFDISVYYDGQDFINHYNH